MFNGIHPGEIIFKEYLKPLNMSASQLARIIKIPHTRICRILNKTNPITADTALRLAKYFRTSPEYWMAMQSSYDLSITKANIFKEISNIPSRPE